MVLDAFRGIKNQTYKDFEAVIVDDGSDDFDAEKAVASIFTEELPRVRTIVLPKTTINERLWNNRQGWILNEIISESDADFFIVHADDDIMHPEYIEKTREYFIEHPEVMYAYGPLRNFDRTKGEVPNDDAPLKTDFAPVSGPGKLDMCQVAFRTQPFKDGTVMFPEGKFWNLDEMAFRQLEKAYGLCEYFPHMTMYKSVGDHTMTFGLHGSEKSPEEWIEKRE